MEGTYLHIRLVQNFRVGFSLLHAMGIVRAMEKVIQRSMVVYAWEQDVVNVLQMDVVCVT